MGDPKHDVLIHTLGDEEEEEAEYSGVFHDIEYVHQPPVNHHHQTRQPAAFPFSVMKVHYYYYIYYHYY